jgi:hypothetical protein
MSDTEHMNPKNNTSKKISGFFLKLVEDFRKFIGDIWKIEYTFPVIVIVFGVLFIFLGPCLLGFKRDFTNELEEVTQEPLEPVNEEIDLINEPNTEKTYENTSLLNTPSSDFEILKNFQILDTNKFISVKEKINDYSNQPTFLPGQFN